MSGCMSRRRLRHPRTRSPILAAAGYCHHFPDYSLTVHWRTRTHSPYPPPWPGHLFPHCLFTVYHFTRTHSPRPCLWHGHLLSDCLLIAHQTLGGGGSGGGGGAFVFHMTGWSDGDRRRYSTAVLRYHLDPGGTPLPRLQWT